MSSRNLGNLLRAYMEYTSDTESSDQYHFWTAATIIAAATRRQVWLEMNYFQIYPNLFVILVGPSGSRKSIAANIGMQLAERAGIKKFSEKITGAALIRDLSTAAEKRVEGQEVELCSPIMIYASELGVFMGPDAYSSGVIADLTDLYDCPKKWEKKTISRDTETVIAPYINVLAASTPQTLLNVIPPGAVGQGFTSRILFIWAPKRRKRVPIPNWGSEHQMLLNNLIADLNSIGKLRGKFQFSPDGLNAYNHFYLEHPEPEEEFEDERLRGYASRKDIHMLKVAMILSLADNNSLLITKKEIEGAIDAIKWMESGLTRVFAGHGSSVTSQDVVRIFQQIESICKNQGYITDQEIFRRNYAHLNGPEIEMVLGTLTRSGAITDDWVKSPVTQRMEHHYRVLDKTFLRQAKQVIPKRLKEET